MLFFWFSVFFKQKVINTMNFNLTDLTDMRKVVEGQPSHHFGLSEREKSFLSALARAGSVKKAKSDLGISEQSIYQRLHRLRLKRYHCQCVVNQINDYGRMNSWLGVLLVPMVRLEREKAEKRTSTGLCTTMRMGRSKPSTSGPTSSVPFVSSLRLLRKGRKETWNGIMPKLPK